MPVQNWAWAEESLGNDESPGETAQWVKTLGAESGALALTPGAYVKVEGENLFHTKLSFNFHICAMAYRLTYHTHLGHVLINTSLEKKDPWRGKTNG